MKICRAGRGAEKRATKSSSNQGRRGVGSRKNSKQTADTRKG